MLLHMFAVELTLGIDANIPIIVANIEDKESLEKMAAMCRVLINCVGPVSLFSMMSSFDFMASL